MVTDILLEKQVSYTNCKAHINVPLLRIDNNSDIRYSLTVIHTTKHVLVIAHKNVSPSL